MGYVFFVVVEIGFKQVTNRDGLGRGDAKLMAAAGVWLGFSAIPIVALIASLSAISTIIAVQIIRKIKLSKIPFGPFISLAIIILWTYRELF